MDPQVITTFGEFTAAALTLLVFTYLLGDNPLYRIALNLLVGVAAGYVFVIVAYNVLWPWIQEVGLPLWDLVVGAPQPAPINWSSTVALLLGLILLLRAFRIASPLGSWVMALMVGVGAAVAIGGAVTGTLVPQMRASFVSLLPTAGLEKWAENLILVVGTIATLASFYYGARGETGRRVERPLPIRWVAPIGKIFIGITLGAMYAGAIMASLALLAHSLYVLAGPFQPK
jgi:hypothetical protein